MAKQPFVYRTRSDDVNKRATRQGGDFIGIFKDEFRVFKVNTGSNSIRILPPTDDDATYYGMDIHVHYSVGPEKATVLCPNKMSKGAKKCPVCEARVRAERADDVAMAKECKTNNRVVVWLLDTKTNEDLGPQLWAMPWTVDRDIAKICRDPKTGETYQIDHPDEGYDIYFDKTGDKDRTEYTGFQLARKPSRLADKHLDFINEHPLSSVLIWRDYDEILKLFNGGEDEAPPPRAASRDAPIERARYVDEEPARPRAETAERRRIAEAADTTRVVDEEAEREALRGDVEKAERSVRPRPTVEETLPDEPPPRARPAVAEPARDTTSARATLRDRFGKK